MSEAWPYTREEFEYLKTETVTRGGTISRLIDTVEARETEIGHLRYALHDAQAIGDFATELRDRLALKENAEACAKMAAEATAKVDELTGLLRTALEKMRADHNRPYHDPANYQSPNCHLCNAADQIARTLSDQPPATSDEKKATDLKSVGNELTDPPSPPEECAHLSCDCCGPEDCPRCSPPGRGAPCPPATDAPCEACGGDGESRKVADSPSGCCSYTIKVPCPSCQTVVSRRLVEAADALARRIGGTSFSGILELDAYRAAGGAS